MNSKQKPAIRRAPDDADEQLASLRTDFSRGAARRRKQLLRHAASIDPADARRFRAWHDQLMFVAAYPDDAEVLRLVGERLRDAAKAVAALRPSDRHAALRRLADTGIAHTDTFTSFTLPMCRQLLDSVGRAIDIDWDEDSAGEALDDFLAQLVCDVERDGLLHTGISTRQWFDLSAGLRDAHALAWLVDRFERLPAPVALRDHAFDALALRLHWRHDGAAASRTFARFPARPIHYQREPLMRSVNTREILTQPLPAGAIRHLSRSAARRLLDVCRMTLCARRRETDPLTYASDRDVTLARLDRGIDVAIFGMVPQRRLPIESYFGFVAARNRVPMAYGGAWIFGDRAEIGVNIFDEFRGGESALLFAQIMRAYHHDLGPRRFYVDPFQFGRDNPEAIRSGAFWFYWRIGFRPTQPAARKLAADETARIAADRNYRSPPNVLRRLAKSPILFDLDRPGADTPHEADIDLRDLGLAVTRWIGRRFKGDREAAQAWSLRRAMPLLKPRDFRSRLADERSAFENLAVLIGPISEIEKWSPRDRHALADVMFAKGAASEREYVHRVRKHRQFQHALNRLARDGTDTKGE